MPRMFLLKTHHLSPLLLCGLPTLLTVRDQWTNPVAVARHLVTLSAFSALPTLESPDPGPPSDPLLDRRTSSWTNRLILLLHRNHQTCGNNPMIISNRKLFRTNTINTNTIQYLLSEKLQKKV